MENISLKKSFENLVREIFSRPPKLGAKSPPMGVMSIYASCNVCWGREWGEEIMHSGAG